MQLKKWRKQTNLSLAELGRLAGLSHTQIMRIENKTSRVSPAAAKRIEAATNGAVTAAELLGLDTVVPKRKSGVAEDAVPFDGTTAVAVPVPSFLLEQARAQGLDVEALIAHGGIDALREASKQAWYDENRDAIEAKRRHIEKYGTFGQRHGVFRPR
tara:strand:- start:544 stop:1014 length:471 start_codon:yes stop_codon:yes gene_type:complete